MITDRQVQIEMSVNGTPLPVTGSSLIELSIVENTQNKLPTLQFTFKDPDNSLHDLTQLVEGAKIGVLLYNAPGAREQPQEITFRCIGSHAQIQGAQLIFKASGIYDSMKYLAGIVNKPIKGTSADAVQQLAQQCGLTATVLQNAQDKMVWMPNRETYNDFLRKIVQHGHAGDKTITAHGVTMNGELIYADLSTKANQKSGVKVVSGSPSTVGGDIPAVGYEIIDMAGMHNVLYNYGSKLVQEQMTGTAETLDKIINTMFDPYLAVDKGIQQLVNSVRSEYMPQDLGNCHANYAKAELQNRKGKGLFSNKVEFTTTIATGLKLFDTFEFEPRLPTNNQISNLWSGNYIVQAKTKFLGSGLQYYEKIRGVSQGYGSNYGGDLVAPES